MGLATRCSSCGTIFRVVQDQLKVSEGWVRCGRCQEVFNALQNLFDLEREAPPPWPPAPAAAAEPPEGEWDRTRPVRPPEPAFVASGGDDAGSADPANLSTQPLLHTASRDLAQEEHGSDPEDTGFEDARFNEALIEEALIGEPQAEEELEVFGASQLEPMPLPPPPPPRRASSAMRRDDEPPRFIVEAERAERWQRPAVRAGLVLALLLLGAGLLAQVGLHWRDELAARWPASRAVLSPLCAAAHCSIQAPRRLESLSVDSSGLTQLETPGQYRLSVVLRNRARTPVLLPALELSLTDAQGELISRRALMPSELGVRQDSLPANAELPMQAAFSVGDLRVVGYTVEIFYP